MGTGLNLLVKLIPNLPSPTTYVDHPEHFHKRLLNFNCGVITSTAATNLDRKEDYYVELTKADLSLNRYKVVS